MKAFGASLRDEYVWHYPDLPGALFTYAEIAGARNWKVTGSTRGVSRAVEYLNNTETRMADGTTDYGMSQFVTRRAYDHNLIGFKSFTWDRESIKYLDPAYLFWDSANKVWDYTLFSPDEKYSLGEVSIHRPIPLGSNGLFISPVAFIIPTAIMAWLLKEHDNAAMDGRKIRDITIVGSEELADQIAQSVEEYLKVYSGANPASNGIPVVYVDTVGQSGVKVEDLITRIGIANIPEGFDRDDFQFKWMNQISTALGMPLRYFWNAEKATNRALEEVQEARSTSRGPDALIAAEQRLINRSGALKQFGPRTRFSYIERVDIASAEINAKVLKANIEALKMLTELSGGIEIDGDSLIRWQQSLGSLPPDLELLKKTAQKNSEPSTFAGKGERIVDSSSDVDSSEKSIDVPDYDEMVMDGNGNILEKRTRVYSVLTELVRDALNDPDFIDEIRNEVDLDE